MSCKVLLISVVFLSTIVSGNRVFNVLKTVKTTESRLRYETLTRQEDDSKLSNRLDAIERLLFMEGEMEESLMLTQKLPEIIDNVRLMSQYMDSLKDALNSTTSALEQSEAKVTALTAKLDLQMKTIEDKLSNNSDAIIEVEMKLTNMSKTLDMTNVRIAEHKSCLSIHKSGQTNTGFYNIYPAKDGVAVQVYCDMTTDGGGWTVFQRRQDGSVDFYRGWEDYKRGFGEVDGEFWLGNDVIADLTSDCCHELRIDLGDFDGAQRYAHYDGFKVSPESDNYKLVISGYSGDAGDSLAYHNNSSFSTKDRDNDLNTPDNCATMRKSAWWYKSCNNSNLNGLYLRGPHGNSTCVNWGKWRGYTYSLKMTEMKLR